MKRTEFFFILLFSLSLLSACGRRADLAEDFDATKTGLLIAGLDGAYYRADCLGQTGDIALNSANAAACKLNASYNRQAANFNYTSYRVINNDFARFFCQNLYRRNSSACFNFFGLSQYQPQPTYQTCNSCVNCPFGGLCPQYCFTRCANPYPNFPPQPTWTPTPTPTPAVDARCPGLLNDIRQKVNNTNFCTQDSDCAQIRPLNDRCGAPVVNRAYANNPDLWAIIGVYNQFCPPAAPVACLMVLIPSSCQNNRCTGGGF